MMTMPTIRCDGARFGWASGRVDGGARGEATAMKLAIMARVAEVMIEGRDTSFNDCRLN